MHVWCLLCPDSPPSEHHKTFSFLLITLLWYTTKRLKQLLTPVIEIVDLLSIYSCSEYPSAASIYLNPKWPNCSANILCPKLSVTITLSGIRWINTTVSVNHARLFTYQNVSE